jgi:hypothetical protein
MKWFKNIKPYEVGLWIILLMCYLYSLIAIMSAIYLWPAHPLLSIFLILYLMIWIWGSLIK